jgi:hypothetical protein
LAVSRLFKEKGSLRTKVPRRSVPSLMHRGERGVVKLFAQHGFSYGLKTVEGLRKELIDGVIFSSRDITARKAA